MRYIRSPKRGTLELLRKSRMKIFATSMYVAMLIGPVRSANRPVWVRTVFSFG